MDWRFELYGNAVQQWLLAGGAALGFYLLLLFLRRVVGDWLAALAARTPWQADDVLADLFRGTNRLFLLVVALEAGGQFLSLPPEAHLALQRVMLAALLLQGAGWAINVVDYLVTRRLMAGQDVNVAKTTRGAIMLVVQVGIWSLAILLLLQNVSGMKVDALIASLGITGVAVALAVQRILGDLFASLSIAIDQPFIIGDTIKVGEMTGRVEKIGLKSTRLLSVSGEQLIFSNADLLSSRIHNLQRMERRRVVLSLGVDYETALDKVERVPAVLEAIVKAQEQVSFERAHLKSLGDFALLFELAYTVESNDFMVFMDVQQRINLEVLRCFQEEGIHLASPTQKLLLQPAPEPERINLARRSLPPGT